MRRTSFPAKILLFGEYGILYDGKALAVPFNKFSGSLLHQTKPSNHNREFNDYIEYLLESNKTDYGINLDQLAKDKKAGLTYQGDIPQGYGVGSSATLVACIYNQYGQALQDSILSLEGFELIQIKNYLASLENYFHGNSSGFDPLVSYLKMPLVLDSHRQIRSVYISKKRLSKVSIFLLNTGQKSDTRAMVSTFLNKMKSEYYYNDIKGTFIPMTERCIKHFVRGDQSALHSDLQILSKYTIEYFDFAIPEYLRDIWAYGLESDLYFLKLCGSGGGGYLLGFTFNFEEVKKILKPYSLVLVDEF